MILGIDGNEANTQERVGIGEYAFELLTQFSIEKLTTQDTKFQIYLKNRPNGKLPKETDRWQYVVFGPRRLWTQVALPLRLYLTKNRPDVFFSPSHYGPRFAPVPTAIAIMDLAYVYYPEFFTKRDCLQLRQWTSYSVKKASRIFTISRASKKDIVAYYKVSEDKVVVTYPGIKSFASLTPSVYPIQEMEQKFGITKPYFLFVGTIQPRKNIERLVEAFADVLNRHGGGLQLVIVGKRGWLYEKILTSPMQYGVEKEVLFLEFVDNRDLPTLYSHAVAFVLPSLYEGFGLPILEAMQYNCPVITSNVSSLPEAGGDAALYVDPKNTSDIAEKMYQVLTDKSLRNMMIVRGKKQRARFSWEKTARQTLSALEELVRKKNER